MVSVNIGQIAFLNAKYHMVDTIYFCGSFMRNNPFVWEKISWAIDFWSEHSMEVLPFSFFVHSFSFMKITFNYIFH